jgi:hypothetical protein
MNWKEYKSFYPEGTTFRPTPNKEVEIIEHVDMTYSTKVKRTTTNGEVVNEELPFRMVLRALSQSAGAAR